LEIDNKKFNDNTYMMNMILAAQAAAGGNNYSFLIMMIAVFALMWFFFIRPQQKQQKKIRQFQNSLQEGTKVVIGGGIYGTVKHIDDSSNKVSVEIARGVVVEVERSYVFADARQQQPNA
jgi:preprotein translocase subunit YajC